MKFTILLCIFTYAAAVAEFPFEEQKMENFDRLFRTGTKEEVKSGLCDLIDGAIGFLKPGMLQWFNGQCLPQIQAQIDACNGGIQNQGQNIVDTLCTDADQAMLTVIDRLPWQSVKDLLEPFFSLPDGVFYTQCLADAGSYILGEINQECAQISHLNPTQLCQQAFNEIYNEAIGGINSVLCGSK